MHPALSIIAFTTLSGLGYGLAALLGLGVLDPAATATRIAHPLALVLIGAGLVSSTLHLGNPQRAWRALSQWRSSWLSREGVMALLTFLPLLCSAWASTVDQRYLWLPGWLGTAGCLVTVYCTSMIYASLRSVQGWNTRLTSLCFILFAMSGGLTAGAIVGFAGGGHGPILAVAGVMASILAWLAKARWRARLHGLEPLSTPESATGLGFIGKVRLFEPPHMNPNYLTREMGFRVARKHAGKLWRLAIVCGAVVAPLCLAIAVGLAASPSIALSLATTALIFHGLGVVVERWLFFAEVRHAVSNYYGI